jgi:hypothetical protein
VDLDIEDTIYRIINGYFYIIVNNINYKIVMPDIEIKYQAHCFYRSIIEDNKFNSSWLNDNQIKQLLYNNKLWSDLKQIQFDELLKSLDQSKIQYFLNFNTESKKKEIKKLIDSINKQINEAYRTKHQFDYLSLESYAQTIKNQYLISKMVYQNKELLFNNFEDLNISDLDPFILEISDKTLGNEEIKTVAHHELWRSYWGANKDFIFKNSVTEWTDEQRSLVNFSRTLDSIREHLEAPTEEVMCDHDALDGWILYQHDKIAKEKKKKHIEEKYGLNSKSGQEVFLMTNTQEETKEIFGLNDPSIRQDIQEMKKAVNSTDKNINWAELPHVKRQLQQQSNEAFKNKLKGE